MSIPGRKYDNGSAYRYGFNGKENDKDFHEGIQDYGMRIYDTRVGRFLSVDPLTKKYVWYTPYQYAGNDVIRNSDIDGKEPWLRNTVQTVSKFRSAITAVSASVTLEAGAVLSFEKGMAVDRDGNILSFTTKGGLLAIQFGAATNAGVSLTGNVTLYNNRITSLTDVLGPFSNGSTSAGWKEVVVAGVTTNMVKGIEVGKTYSLGIGYSAMPAGVSFVNTNTAGIILTGREYDKVYNDKKNAESQSFIEAQNMTEEFALSAGAERGRPTYRDYAHALYSAISTTVKTNYVPVEGQKNMYEIVYEYSISITALPTNNPGGKPVIITKNFNTGVKVKADGKGNYISPNYAPPKTD